MRAGRPSQAALARSRTPLERFSLWQIVRELAADNVTIFLTTQYLEEADELADRFGVLDRGRLVAEGSPSELTGYL